MASKTAKDAIMRPHAIMLAAAALAAIMPGHAAEDNAVDQRLLVGKTNIFCVQAPCPWRGIADANNPGSGPAGLLRAEQTLPPIDATEEDAQRIVDAWNADRCLAIAGRLVDGRLIVNDILGDCP